MADSPDDEYFGPTLDMDTFRHFHESDERWLIRKTFMDRYKVLIPKNVLLQLSERLGRYYTKVCKYMEPTVEEIFVVGGILVDEHLQNIFYA